MSLREKLTDLALALRVDGETNLAELAEAALAGCDDQLQRFLTSNELWGGSGAVADQAGIRSDPKQRRRIATTLIALGTEQLGVGLVNARTQSWVGAYEEWARGKPR